MEELTFRGRDRYRPSGPRFAVTGLLVVVWGIYAYFRLGSVAWFWVTAVMVVIGGLGTLASLRSWTKVGAAGISICWGIGRGRTYRWQDILWIDIRQLKGGAGTSRAARITLVDGRRRSLPALQDSAVYPQATFDTDFHRVVNWWMVSTDPAARVQPPKQARDRVTPRVFGLLLGVLLIVVTFVIAYVSS